MMNTSIYKPIYIIFNQGKTPMVSNSIKRITHSEYSHISISFDESMLNIYSYCGVDNGVRTNGFTYETILDYDDNLIQIFVMFVNAKYINILKSKVNDHANHDTVFDVSILLRKLIHVDRKNGNEYRQVCSTFINQLLKSINVDISNNNNIPSPADMYQGMNNFPDKIIPVYFGKASDYNQRFMKMKINNLYNTMTPITESCEREVYTMEEKAGMNINKESCSNIENDFDKLRVSINDTSALNDISSNLRVITGKVIDVTVVTPTSENQACMVMSVYPDKSTIDEIIDIIANEGKLNSISIAWAKCPKWYIEIDSRILSDKVNLRKEELTSLLLHEIGHIVYSDSIPAKINKAIQIEYAKTGMVNKAILKDNMFTSLISIPVLGLFDFSKNRAEKKNELRADKYAIKCGYGEDLASAIDKIYVYAGLSSTTTDDDVKSLMGFSIDSLNMLQDRRNHIVRKNLNRMIMSTPSRYTKSILDGISTTFSGSTLKEATVNESVKDEFIANKLKKITDEFYASEAFFTRTKKLKKIDPADIDYIGLELNSIKSNDDKMMVVSYIYSKLDIINYYIAILDSKNPKYVVPHSKESLESMRDTLLKYKDNAINRKLPEINYGISIQYPTGYEG